MIELVHSPEIEHWLTRSTSHLVAHEAENNLLLGVAGQIRQGLYSHGLRPYLATVVRGDNVVGAVLRTPPHNLLLSYGFPDEGHSVLVEDLASESEPLSGVLAERRTARRFVDEWGLRTGVHHRLGMRMRIFSTHSVELPPPVPGRWRRGRAAERRLLASWIEAFVKEALGHEPDADDTTRTLDNLLRFEEGGLFVWDDEGPVSMAAYEGPTPNGVRVNAVYTPPDKRGHGYATACVAHLTRWLLDEGRKIVFLFTDLANPASNAIYSRIGYSPVCDVDEYLFGKGA